MVSIKPLPGLLVTLRLILLLPITLTTANPVQKANLVAHEKRGYHPEWTRTRRLEPDVSLPPLRIGLKQHNLDALPGLLLAISDPTSPTYGQHWSPEEVVNAFAPAPHTGDTVRRWLIDAGFGKNRIGLSANKAWMEVGNVTVKEAEGVLGTEYFVYQHESGEEHVGCAEYFVPEGVAGHIDFITPTVTVQHNTKLSNGSNALSRRAVSKTRHRRDVIKSRGTTKPADLQDCVNGVTPDCLRALYNITYVPQATDRNTFGIANYYNNVYSPSDLDGFFANFSPALVGKRPDLVSINGGNLEIDENTDAGEIDWILEYAMSLTQPQPVSLLQIGNKIIGPQSRSFNDWLDAVDGSYCTSQGGDDFTYDPQLPNPIPGQFNDHSCGVTKPPNVVSNSQAAHEYSISQFYEERQCNEFAKLGLMGVTVLFAAGNVGVAGTTSGYCIDENNSMNLNATRFNPGWPATCPWVTVVGGTQIKANQTRTPANAPLNRPLQEEVWNMDLTLGFFESGGGGFSNRFPTPAYQKEAVGAYLSWLRKTDPEKLKHFNSSGRAYPDISANALNFVDFSDGAFELSSGTSGAVPTVASVITLVNDARIAAGKKPVGFINPTIYSTEFASAFNDITSGTNQGCKGLQGDRGGGFEATSGWDPASGVGTPNLGKLIEKWLRLP